MQRLSHLSLLAIAVFAISGCAARSGYYHRVEKGQTSYRIAKAYGINLEDLARANNLREPGAIREGQYLLIPGADQEAPVGSAPDAVARGKAGKRVASLGRPRARSVPSLRGRFIWPVKGDILIGFGSRDKHRHNGIDIAAKEGDVVAAVAPGQVIYAGEKIQGSGKTVIIRHAEQLFSIYSHLGELKVADGSAIKQGETVGLAGAQEANGHHNGVAKPFVHFELRERTIPLDPINLLP